MKFARAKLDALRPTHAAYVAALERLGRWEGDWLVGVPRGGMLAQMREHQRTEQLERQHAVMRARLRRWPAPAVWAARLMARSWEPGDRGLGDTVARRLGKGGERFKVWFHAVFGRSCGCVDRQEWLNREFPYGAGGVLLEAPEKLSTAWAAPASRMAAQ